MRANILLFCGALLGITLAASGLLEDNSTLPSQSETVAIVNDVAISNDQFTSITRGIENNKQSNLKDDEYDYILQKLIDEELLVQRGQELGLLQLNSVIRNSISQAVTASIISENASIEVSDSDLASFYQKNKHYFQSASKVKFQHMRFSQKETALEAISALQEGGSFKNIKSNLADPEIIDIPLSLLSLTTIRQYLGPTLTEQLVTIPKQTLSPIIKSETEQGEFWYIFYIIEKELGQAPAFETIKSVVEKEYLRQLNENSIRDYIHWLRKRASIEKHNTKELKALIQDDL